MIKIMINPMRFNNYYNEDVFNNYCKIIEQNIIDLLNNKYDRVSYEKVYRTVYDLVLKSNEEQLDKFTDMLYKILYLNLNKLDDKALSNIDDILMYYRRTTNNNIKDMFKKRI